MRKPLKINQPMIGREEMVAVAEVLKDGVLTHKSGSGPKVIQFEKEFASYVGCKHAVAVNSGTAALHASLLALDIGVRDEVLVPSFTFAATVEAIVLAGAKPVFVDIDPHTYCIRTENIERKITNRTAAIVPVHLYGLPAEMSFISRLAREHGLTVIEDAAQALGAEYLGRRIGSISDATCFSFYGVKNITTGEGGMITTNDGELAEKLRSVRVHGEERPYWVTRLGHNYRMTEVAAAIGIAQLKKLPGFLERRRRNARYASGKLSGLRKLETPVEPEGRKHAWHLYTVRLKGANAGRRNSVVKRLRAKNIEASVYYETPVHLLPFYRHLGSSYRRDLLETERAARQVFSLPVHPSVTEDDLDEVAVTLEKILAKQ
ncbi:MAG: DegT/DnrJ/EryC1/StrS family aminotransferase [Candidatus Bathyarchaeia archaeon]